MTKPGTLTESQSQLLRDLLARQPNPTEQALVAAMWSEHCSYTSSKVWLRRLPTAADWVVQGPGENAGVIDIGGEQLVVFKIESHNHPSYIEPYQGAATGVGGILRDILAMGARPLASLNALRFGNPQHSKTRNLLARVVAGIGGYGNCIGVPTVGSKVGFDPSYNGNILVNVMMVGLTHSRKLSRSQAVGVGNPVLYIGAATGLDGVQGAVMASASFSSKQQGARSTVQIGDPFLGKMLIEAMLELHQAEIPLAVQDMGAAGLCCASLEMAAKGNLGMILELGAIPLRAQGMSVQDIMLSESQERMLIVVKAGDELRAKSICQRWQLDCQPVGQLTDDGLLTVKLDGQVHVLLPARQIIQSAPCCERPWLMPHPVRPGPNDLSSARSTESNNPQRSGLSSAEKIASGKPVPKTIPGASGRLGNESRDSSWDLSRDLSQDLPGADLTQALKKLLSSPSLASRRWIWEQYDSQVGADTILGPGQADAAVVRIYSPTRADKSRALALSIDSTPRYCKADPFQGAMQTVAECWRNLSAVGAMPLAITDNLNFGNPERAEIMGQVVECINGLRQACLELKLPVVSGNVSFYNQTDDQSILPTPVIGGVGVLDDATTAVGIHLRLPDQLIILVGDTQGQLGQSLYAHEIIAYTGGAMPTVDLQGELRNGNLIRKVIRRGLVSACHDLSDGGLVVALAEMTQDVGAEIVPPENLQHRALAAWLFGEDQGRYLLATSNPDQVLEQAFQDGVKATVIGQTGGNYLTVADTIRLSLGELLEVRESWLPQWMEPKVPAL